MATTSQIPNGKLMTELRRNLISESINADGAVTTEELVSRFGVSLMTIWRDLTALEENGLLRKVRGGAVRVEPRGGEEPLYTSKQVINLELKEAIARYAVEHFVRDGDIIFMEAGTTVAAMARHLRRYRQLTVIGNGLGTMNELAPLVPDLTVYCCGGMLRAVANTFVGPQAEEYFRHINASTCFLSATGVSFPEGITDVSLLEIQVKRAMAHNAGRVVFLMDSTKFGAKSFARVLEFDAIQTLVTDDGAPAAYVEQLKAAGIEVHVVPGSS
jgi:DeoR/GlpR family transcriptional regulator of sugar metabolism